MKQYTAIGIVFLSVLVVSCIGYPSTVKLQKTPDSKVHQSKDANKGNQVSDKDQNESGTIRNEGNQVNDKKQDENDSIQTAVDDINTVNSQENNEDDIDMMLTPGQQALFVDDRRNKDDKTPRMRRNAAVKALLRWPNAIVPYSLNGISRRMYGYTRKVEMIKKVMRDIESVSCVRFVPRTNEKMYLNISTNHRGCWSYVGYNSYWFGSSGSGQPMSLSYYCYHEDIIIHELFHALGFFHTQNRPDRDNYVKIEWENIKSGKQRNFFKLDEGRIGTVYDKYDPESIMHYGRYTFSKQKNQLPTIVAFNNNKKLGGKTLSHDDILQLNTLYSCSTTQAILPAVTTTTTTTTKRPTTVTTTTKRPTTATTTISTKPTSTATTTTTKPTTTTTSTTPTTTTTTTTIKPTTATTTTSTKPTTTTTTTPTTTTTTTTMKPTTMSTKTTATSSTTRKPTTSTTTGSSSKECKDDEGWCVYVQIVKSYCSLDQFKTTCKKSCKQCN